MNDEGISELLGYAILIGMAATAVICVTSGAAGAVFSSAERIGHVEAAASVKSLADITGYVARTNNTCFVACELQMPAGYELIAFDRQDDIARLEVTLGDKEIPAVRTGSIRLQSPFRSVSFEGGAAFSNDGGPVEILRKPSIYIVSRNGRAELYIHLLCITADTGMILPDAHAVLEIRAETQRSETISVPVSAGATITLSSRDADGWAGLLAGEGFAVTHNGNIVTATRGGVTCVHVTCVTLQVRPGR